MLKADVRGLILALASLAGPALAGDLGGFPKGTWILDETRSKSMAAKSQTLTIIEDDGRVLSFTLLEPGADGTPKLLKWQGVYGEAPHLIEGRAITFGVAHGPNGSVLISGHRPEDITFRENCQFAPGRHHLRCAGTQWSSDGRKSTYLEIFDLQR
jgi:hypothetical protein